MTSAEAQTLLDTAKSRGIGIGCAQMPFSAPDCRLSLRPLTRGELEALGYFGIYTLRRPRDVDPHPAFCCQSGGDSLMDTGSYALTKIFGLGEEAYTMGMRPFQEREITAGSVSW